MKHSSCAKNVVPQVEHSLHNESSYKRIALDWMNTHDEKKKVYQDWVKKKREFPFVS